MTGASVGALALREGKCCSRGGLPKSVDTGAKRKGRLMARVAIDRQGMELAERMELLIHDATGVFSTFRWTRHEWIVTAVLPEGYRLALQHVRDGQADGDVQMAKKMIETLETLGYRKEKVSSEK